MRGIRASVWGLERVKVEIGDRQAEKRDRAEVRENILRALDKVVPTGQLTVCDQVRNRYYHTNDESVMIIRLLVYPTNRAVASCH